MQTLEQNINPQLQTLMLKVNVKPSGKFVLREYDELVKSINEKPYQKVYKDLKSTLKESYLTGSLKYGRNFVL